MTGRDGVKAVARGVALIVMLPALASFVIRAWLMGRDRALQSSSEWLALVPGLAGQYLRRAFYSRALASCDRTVVIEAGTILCRAGTRLDAHSYIGGTCRLGLVHVEHDVLIASGVHIPSGTATHGIEDPTVPIREQARNEEMVRIGSGAWIGEGALVMADVGRESVIGAGAVVTRRIPSWTIAAGVPARVLRARPGIHVRQV